MNVINITPILMERAIDRWHREFIDEQPVQVYEDTLVSYEVFKSYKRKQELLALIDKWADELNLD